MRKSIYYIILCAGFFLITPSCEKNMLGDDPVSDPYTNFSYLWQQVKNKYSYFEYKGVDWDSVYNVYSEQIHEDMSDHELYNVMTQMLQELHDGHVNLICPYSEDHNWSWFIGFSNNFNMQDILRNYLGHDHDKIGPMQAQVIDSVLYVYYSSFANEITEADVDTLVEQTTGLNGLVIDIRQNGGGSLKNAITLGAAFTEDEYLYGMSRIKNGTGPDDFSPWKDLVITPRDGARYSGKIAVLSNRFSYSSSSYFAQMMKVNPNAVLMGDHTGGGGGIPAYGELPNGWIYRLSTSQTMNPEGKHIEGGVMVDYRVKISSRDKSRGIDPVIETAIEYLNQQ